MGNKRGFTLIELLGVVVILSILLLIAIPRIASVTENSKKTQYLNDAKKMVSLVVANIKSGRINKPSSEETVKISLKDLKTNEIEKDKDGLTYDIENSYVYITRKEGNLEYYVQLVANRKNGKYRGILLINSKELDKNTQYEKYYEIIDELLYIDPDDVDSGVFNVGITGSNVNLSESNIKIGFNKSKSIIVTPLDGYYLSSVKCINGYTTNAMTGKEMTGRQIVTISNNKVRGESKCTFTASKIEYKVSLNLTHINSSEEEPLVKYLDNKRIDITPEEGYYLDNVSCSEGYSIEAVTGIEGIIKQTVVITNTGTRQGGTCNIEGRRAYPKVTGGSDVWTTGTRNFTITEPTPSGLVTRYEYYISDSNTQPGQDVIVTGSFTGSSINIGENGRYVYFRIIYANGVVSNWTSAKNLYVDKADITAPTVIGGDTLLTKSKTFLLTNNVGVSGISRYEYYISNTTDKPTNQNNIIQLMSPSVTINDNGKYIFFRLVNNAGVVSEWTDAINLYVDANEYEITYNLNGGKQEGEPAASYDVEAETYNLPTPTKNGYVFDGWYENSNLTGNKETQIVKGVTYGNKNYYAKWDLTNYTITYNLNGGTNPSGAVTSYNTETNSFNLPEPTKGGYAFDGWYENSNLTGNAVQSIPRGSTGNKTYYAKWYKASFTINYQLNDGTFSSDPPFNYSIDTETFNIPTPTRTGYKFEGWYGKNDFSGNKITQIVKGSTGDITIYAKWDITNYTITYNLNGGTNPSGAVTSYNATTNTFNLPEPTRTGFKFEGWYANSSLTGNKVTQIKKGTTGNKTYYAKWKANTYTITLNNQSATTAGTASVTGTYGSAIPSITKPTKTNYTFGGYYTETGGRGTQYIKADGTSAKNWDKTSATTLYAKWIKSSIVKGDTVYDYGSVHNWKVLSVSGTSITLVSSGVIGGWTETREDGNTEVSRINTAAASYNVKNSSGTVRATCSNITKAQIESYIGSGISLNVTISDGLFRVGDFWIATNCTEKYGGPYWVTAGGLVKYAYTSDGYIDTFGLRPVATISSSNLTWDSVNNRWYVN